MNIPNTIFSNNYAELYQLWFKTRSVTITHNLIKIRPTHNYMWQMQVGLILIRLHYTHIIIGKNRSNILQCQNEAKSIN